MVGKIILKMAWREIKLLRVSEGSSYRASHFFL